ncbi:transmembrane protein 135-like [Clytia hemisphaerica]|uniref:Transmembrane protein 135 N-terminal domain-containing protein n=1 Tax=Clytia hemisphaerica TaxID=252671 RepID=A0A7M5V4Q3_9CNID|eukprot:TCONS_00030754-protein
MPSIFSKFTDVQCDVAGHTWDKSCRGSAFSILINCLKYALSVYVPLYTASALLNRKGKIYFMKKLYMEIAQSSAFLAANGFFMVVFFCLVRKILGGYYPWSAGFLPGCLSSFVAISIERKSRRGALAVYMLNTAFDTIFNMLKHHGLAKDVPFGEVIIFAAAASALGYMYRTKNLPDGFIKSIIQKGDVRKIKQTMIVTRSIDESRLHFELSAKLAGKSFVVGYGIQTAYNFLMFLVKSKKSIGAFKRALISMDSLRLGGFCGSLVFLYNTIEKLLDRINKGKEGMNSAIAGAVAGCSMVLQRSSYISLYVLSKTLELFYMNGIQKGQFPYIKHFDTILYTLCTGLMFHGAILQPTYLKPTYWNFLIKLTGKRFGDINRKYWDVLGYDSSLSPESIGR